MVRILALVCLIMVGSMAPALADTPNSPSGSRAQSDSTIRDCPACPELVIVPAGRFMMGANNKNFSDRSQLPLHQVTIARSFAVGRFEITFDEWRACREDLGCSRYKPRDEKWGRGGRPVIHVSWPDAMGYIDWLKRKTGKKYRLLSESEWEYAARAGQATLFAVGDTITTDQANFDGRLSFNNGPVGAFLAKTRPVGSYKANAFGLFDMHGNVAEWVADCHYKTYKDAPDDGAARMLPHRGHRCHRRSVRGGSYRRGAKSLRSGARTSRAATIRNSEIGFRVARDLD